MQIIVRPLFGQEGIRIAQVEESPGVWSPVIFDKLKGEIFISVMYTGEIRDELMAQLYASEISPYPEFFERVVFSLRHEHEDAGDGGIDILSLGNSFYRILGRESRALSALNTPKEIKSLEEGWVLLNKLISQGLITSEEAFIAFRKMYDRGCQRASNEVLMAMGLNPTRLEYPGAARI